MHDVAILGAGELGGSLAHVLARRDIVRSICLIDATGQVAAGKALDIMQSAPIEPFATRVSSATDPSLAAGAGIVVLADRANATEWTVDEGYVLLAQLQRAASRAVIVCAGAGHRELIERGIHELHLRTGQLFGTAPEALASAVRALVALEADCSVKDVALTALGVPPHDVVVPWEDATVMGVSAVRTFDEPALRRLAARAASLWPPGAYALAHAAAEAIACVFGRSRRTLSCFVAPPESSGRRFRTAALPVRLGASGIARVEKMMLNGSDRVALDNAMLL